MKLKDISDIHSGYISRGKVEASARGHHFLLQAKNVDGDHLAYDTERLLRFQPKTSPSDRFLQKDDLLFMARGSHNFTIQLQDLPPGTLAAACFFIVRISNPDVLPAYLCWYLNQRPVKQYLYQYSGRNVHMPVVRRAVLENIPIPTPSLNRQAEIADLNALMLKEIHLLHQLGKKRRDLITAACLQTATAIGR